MKTKFFLPIALVALSLMLCSWTGNTSHMEVSTDPIIIKEVLDFDEILYIDCIGESVHFTGKVYVTITIVSDEAGGYHFKVAASFPQSKYVGQTSGTVWRGGGAYVENFNSSNGETFTVRLNERYRAPRNQFIQWTRRDHYTVNAHGELVNISMEGAHSCN